MFHVLIQAAPGPGAGNPTFPGPAPFFMQKTLAIGKRVRLRSAAMGFIKALIVWFAMAAVIGFGVVLAAKGSPLLLIISTLLFVVGVGKLGCSTH